MTFLMLFTGATPMVKFDSFSVTKWSPIVMQRKNDTVSKNKKPTLKRKTAV